MTLEQLRLLKPGDIIYYIDVFNNKKKIGQHTLDEVEIEDPYGQEWYTDYFPTKFEALIYAKLGLL